MPRRKTNQSQSVVSTAASDETNSTFSSVWSEMNTMDLAEIPIHSLGPIITENFQSIMQQIEAKLNYELRNLSLAFNLLKVEISEKLLNTAIGSDYEELWNIFSDKIENGEDTNKRDSVKNKTAIKRRRSRSVRDASVIEFSNKKRESSMSLKRRSRSLDAFKTPVNKAWLSAMTSAKKYTVSKPERIEDSAVSLKRIMKPNEEAISLSGSPLIVHPSITNAPTVTIPLPGGVVMNIEPKKVKGKLVVPELDGKTKRQLKLLWEQMHQMI